MRERNLLKILSNYECLNASIQSFTSAEMHKASAHTLANKELFGNAVAHLVLSSEELVKSLLFLVQHFDINIRNVNGVHLFFTDHIIKHRLATMVTLISPIIKTFIGFVKKEHRKLHYPGSRIEYSELEIALMKKDEKKVALMFKDLPEMMDWWEDANLRKNKGFYVDYSSSLETPMQVTKEEYIHATKVTGDFHDTITQLLTYLKEVPENDMKQFAGQSKQLGLENLLTRIIDLRKKEMKSRKLNSSIFEIVEPGLLKRKD